MKKKKEKKKKKRKEKKKRFVGNYSEILEGSGAS